MRRACQSSNAANVARTAAGDVFVKPHVKHGETLVLQREPAAAANCRHGQVRNVHSRLVPQGGGPDG